MPYGNKQMYGKDYIMKQMKKQGEFNDANESALYREKLEFGVGTKQGVLTENFPCIQDHPSNALRKICLAT